MVFYFVTFLTFFLPTKLELCFRVGEDLTIYCHRWTQSVRHTLKLDPLCLFCMCPRKSFMSLLFSEPWVSLIIDFSHSTRLIINGLLLTMTMKILSKMWGITYSISLLSSFIYLWCNWNNFVNRNGNRSEIRSMFIHAQWIIRRT